MRTTARSVLTIVSSLEPAFGGLSGPPFSLAHPATKPIRTTARTSSRWCRNMISPLGWRCARGYETARRILFPESDPRRLLFEQTQPRRTSLRAGRGLLNRKFAKPAGVASSICFRDQLQADELALVANVKEAVRKNGGGPARVLEQGIAATKCERLPVCI